MPLDKMNDASRFNMWMPKKLHEQCLKAASDDDRSLASWIRIALQNALPKKKRH